ncbi:zinc-dependent alcohol dehydrogenase family protein [Occallatibacter savannae]|uniref:zinc-dependent alcohol dehydrogenase family protein n=1 Tax=Occallatibacter savannae TaxID=1002691 RepID=UPI000D685666|nr:zinc-dependent alcohol dehydrogenase family protein [Occallatibacter savannae]
MRKHRVWQVETSGGPFIEVEVVRPAPKPGEVLVRIAASGVNPLDTKIRAGKAEHAKQALPAVLGLDMAGTVEEVGAGVTEFRPGEAVFGMVGGVGGRQGTLGEYVAADARLLAHKPKTLSMREAAVLPLSTITAWEGLVDRAQVHAGQKVLVHAGAGGVGHVCVQIARAFGADVYATVSSSKKHLVEQYGAMPVDYRALSVDEYVETFTGGAGFDVVYDTVGGATIDESFKAVRRYTGHVVSCLGWSTHSLAPLSFRGATYSGVFTLYPMLSGVGLERHGKILRKAAALADEGKLRPLLNSERFTTADLDGAYAAVEAGSTGKVVVEMQNER